MVTLALNPTTKLELLKTLARRVEVPYWENRNRAEAKREADVLASQLLEDLWSTITRRPHRLVGPGLVEI